MVAAASSSPSGSAMTAAIPETVIVIAARGWAGGTAAALRTLVERLVRRGPETAMVADAQEAAKALIDDEGAVVMIDVERGREIGRASCRERV